MAITGNGDSAASNICLFKRLSHANVRKRDSSQFCGRLSKKGKRARGANSWIMKGNLSIIQECMTAGIIE